LKFWQEEKKACAEKREAIPVEIEVVAERQKIHNEGALVETIAALEDRYGDQHLDATCRQQRKKWTQGDSMSPTQSLTICNKFDYMRR
jgi:hypothetical protein